MAFDKTNLDDLALLKLEMETDPISMGYGLLDNTNKQVDLINDSERNVGLEIVGEVLTPALLLDLIVPSDLTIGGQFTQGELDYLKLIYESTNNARDSIERYRTQILALFGNSTTTDNINAATRRISRSEVLFGVDTTITRQDWLAARDS
jgi:hypothetical protein